MILRTAHIIPKVRFDSFFFLTVYDRTVHTVPWIHIKFSLAAKCLVDRLDPIFHLCDLFFGFFYFHSVQNKNKSKQWENFYWIIVQIGMSRWESHFPFIIYIWIPQAQTKITHRCQVDEVKVRVRPTLITKTLRKFFSFFKS